MNQMLREAQVIATARAGGKLVGISRALTDHCYATYLADLAVDQQFQGRGIATHATAQVVERARAEGTHRYLHAFPVPDNGPSNAICRKLGFTLLGEVEIEFPVGHFAPSNDWRLDLHA